MANPESFLTGDFEDIEQLQEEIRTESEVVEDKSKFEVFFEEPYREIKAVLDQEIKPGAVILDIGVNQGNLEDHLEQKGELHQIDCVDIDEESLSKLIGKEYKNLTINVTKSDANEFLDQYNSKVDVILINATLHEINTPQDQPAYLEWLFEKVKKILKPGGKIIIGDYYYSDEVSDEEVADFIAYQQKTINHADARNKFIKPELIEQLAEESGYEIEPRREILAVKEIDRRYYVLVIKYKG